MIKIVLILSAVVIYACADRVAMRINERRFYRTNTFGVMTHNGYGDMLRFEARNDWLALGSRLLRALALILVLAGLATG